MEMTRDESGRQPLCHTLLTSGEIDTNYWLERDKDCKQVAKSYCFQCPIQSNCLKLAKEGKESFGIWGGIDFDNEPVTKDKSHE